MSAAAAPAAPLVHPLSVVINNYIDGGVREVVVPCGGTSLKISAGAETLAATSQPLSTGRPLQGRRMDEETQVRTAPDGGARFGGYTGPKATQTALKCSALAVSTAPAVAVAR